MKKVRIISPLLAILFFSCSKDFESVTTITVASEKGICNIVNDFPCYIVKYKGSNTWTTMTEGISGFDYEKGYEYVLKVEKSRSGSSHLDSHGYYRLISVVSKILKDSERLPPPLPCE